MKTKMVYVKGTLLVVFSSVLLVHSQLVNLRGTQGGDAGFNAELSDNVANAISNMGYRIMKEIGFSKKKSELISPVSIANAISVAELGAKGDTFKELSNLLGFSRISEPAWLIHDHLGMILEDLSYEIPNPARARQKESWKVKKEIIELDIIENRFNFPTESSDISSTFPTYPTTRRTKKTTTTRTTTETPVFERIPMDLAPSPILSQDSNGEKNTISVANAVFVQSGYSIRPDYKAAAEQIYKSEVKALDFKTKAKEAAEFITEWVDKKTNGRIKNFISKDSVARAGIIIVNALYFKADWLDPFGLTMSRPFYPEGQNGPAIMTDLMYHDYIFPYYDAREIDARILGFPYKFSETTMYIILPNDSNRKKVNEVQKALNADSINSMIAKMEIKHASVFFPKLKLKTSYGLEEIVERLGVKSLFDPAECDLSLISSGNQKSRPALHTSSLVENRNTDPNASTEEKLVFSRNQNETYDSQQPVKRQIVDASQSLKNLDYQRLNERSVNPGLYADKLIHKVDLTVNEIGTEGGAATGLTIDRIAASVRFHVNVPFIILIRHDATRIPLFYGVVYDPTN